MRGGLNQTQLAKKIGVSRKAISDWEVGKEKPSMSKVLTILEHYLEWTKQLELPGLGILVAATEQQAEDLKNTEPEKEK